MITESGTNDWWRRIDYLTKATSRYYFEIFHTLTENEAEIEVGNTMSFCESKADAFVARMEELITPRYMYVIEPALRYHHNSLTGDWPNIFIILADTVCDNFLAFSHWTAMRTPGVPESEAAEDKNDEWVPSRRRLLSQIDETIHGYVLENMSNDIVVFYKEKALNNWEKIRRLVILQSIVWYWVHVANKPESAGYYSGMRETCFGS